MIDTVKNGGMLDSLTYRTSVCKCPLTDMVIVLGKSELAPFSSLREFVNVSTEEVRKDSCLRVDPWTQEKSLASSSYLGLSLQET